MEEHLLLGFGERATRCGAVGEPGGGDDGEDVVGRARALLVEQAGAVGRHGDARLLRPGRRLPGVVVVVVEGGVGPVEEEMPVLLRDAEEGRDGLQRELGGDVHQEVARVTLECLVEQHRTALGEVGRIVRSRRGLTDGVTRRRMCRWRGSSCMLKSTPAATPVGRSSIRVPPPSRPPPLTEENRSGRRAAQDTSSWRVRHQKPSPPGVEGVGSCQKTGASSRRWR